MSRIGKKPISVPAGVTVTCENNHVTVKGPKGEIAKQFSPELGIAVEDGVITVTRPTDDKEHRSLHGLTRTLIANMVEGVTNGYSKTLIIEGVGYRAAKKGKEVVLSVGFSHPVNVPETDDIKLDVPQPIHALEKNRQPMIFQQGSSVAPFMLDESSANEPTIFQVFFRVGEKEYQYYISLKEEIVFESLLWRTLGGKKTGLIFERDGQKIELGASINKASINLDVNPKMPYLSFLAINYNIPVIAEVQNWFESCITQSYANPRAENIVLVSKSETTKESLIHALNDVGIDLSGYRYDEDSKHLFTQRTINGKVYELPFEAESDGTKKMIAALPVLMVALQEGRTVVVDELDAKLHPKLLRYVIQMFKNPELNKKGAQLLFSSHDLTTMKNTVFRRDEIWFAAMNDNHESEIYSLYEFRQEDNTRVKSTAAFDKQYLEGRYGADPYLSNMLTGRDWA